MMMMSSQHCIVAPDNGCIRVIKTCYTVASSAYIESNDQYQLCSKVAGDLKYNGHDLKKDEQT